ncbi:hypothetical protein ACOBQJ_02825 [Pelotomaculum propionicicum]|uniref:hypothetical protein n=1 Tax=Pelotomaculum propionicicum TaxID=258475 RepID=UPI003B7756C3
MAEIARLVTDSKLSNQEILIFVGEVDQGTRDKVSLEIDLMVKERKLPIGEAFPLVRDGFNQIAMDNNMDQAVLFWIYMDWLNKQVIRVKIR